MVVEFPRELPRDVLVTFDFYYENTFKKLGTVPTVILGPRVVKAKFIGEIPAVCGKRGNRISSYQGGLRELMSCQN